MLKNSYFQLFLFVITLLIIPKTDIFGWDFIEYISIGLMFFDDLRKNDFKLKNINLKNTLIVALGFWIVFFIRLIFYK